jgi:hypothetical protein
MIDVTTTNIADFGWTERQELIRLLTIWQEKGLPEGFDTDNVHVMFNKNSGKVFLTNDEYQAAMMNGDGMEIWHSCFNCGHEGFEEDCQLNDEGCNACFPKDNGQ